MLMRCALMGQGMRRENSRALSVLRSADAKLCELGTEV